ARIQLPQGLQHPQSSTHGALRIVLVRQGVAKVDQQPIAEILRDMTLKALDHGRASLLISAYHLAQLFRIQTRCERRRVDQITEQHGQLAPFAPPRLMPPPSSPNRHPPAS